ncbi:MAG: hypothetical protein ABI645_01550 [Pseudomonadota bacterium]
MKPDNAAMLEQQIESTLAQLPEWQPPSDFAKRLAAVAVAVAARQTAAPVSVPPGPAWNEIVPLTLLSVGLAVVLGWVVPWSQLSAGYNLVWTCVAAMGAAGAFLTLRVLRAP